MLCNRFHDVNLFFSFIVWIAYRHWVRKVVADFYVDWFFFRLFLIWFRFVHFDEMYRGNQQKSKHLIFCMIIMFARARTHEHINQSALFILKWIFARRKSLDCFAVKKTRTEHYLSMYAQDMTNKYLKTRNDSVESQLLVWIGRTSGIARQPFIAEKSVENYGNLNKIGIFSELNTIFLLWHFHQLCATQKIKFNSEISPRKLKCLWI